MKVCRMAAFGLVMVLCLIATAPAVHAADGASPGRTAMIGWSGDWAAAWVERLAGWLGWRADEPRPTAQPRPVVEAAKGDCTSSSGTCSPPPPTTFSECTGGLDPNGVPCKP